MKIFQYNIRWKRWIFVFFGIFLLLSIYSIIFSIQFLMQKSEQAAINEIKTKIADKIDKAVFRRLEGNITSLSRSEEIVNLLRGRTGVDNPEVLITLNTARQIFDASIVYVLNKKGDVVACTPHGKDNQTLTGRNYTFRPYFSKSIKGENYIYSALGLTTHDRGIYFSVPVYINGDTDPAGVVVTKIDSKIVDDIIKEYDTPVFLITPEGVVFSSNQENAIYHHVAELSPEKVLLIQESRQFIDEKIKPLAIDFNRKKVIYNNISYIVIRNIKFISGWEMIALQKEEGFYVLGKKYVISIIVIIIILLMIIIFLFQNNLLLRKSEIALQKSTVLYQSLFDLAPDALCITTLSGNILSFNSVFSSLTGYSSDDLLKINIKELYSNPEKDRPLLINALIEKKILKNYPLILKNAAGKKVITSNSMILIDYKNEICIETVMRDITAQVSIEEQLHQAQKMETIGNLAGGLAHDFNNALGGITGTISLLNLQLIQDGKISEDNLKSNLEIMNDSANRAADMVRQLLTLSRKQEIAFTQIDLNKSVNNVMKICASTFNKCIELEACCSGQPAIIYADATQIEQVLLNLCINAGHAMTIMRGKDDVQGGKLTIAVEKIHPDDYFFSMFPEAENTDYWVVSVKDTGIGFDDATKEKIFEPFFSTKNKEVGTGLGLSMVYNIVKQHHGFIQVYSEIGYGTVFKNYFPSLNSGSMDVAGKKKISLVKGQGLVLVIDDDAVMRSLAEKILKECGYEVLVAEDGQEGLKLFKNNYSKIQAVILDMMMPKMSGKATYQAMKKIQKSVKVLLVSGFKEDEHVRELLNLGIKDFIQKPYTLEKISKKLSDIINT